MNRTTQLKRLIQAKEILVMPGVYDALSAKIAEKCGVKAVQVTGYGLAGAGSVFQLWRTGILDLEMPSTSIMQ